MARVRWLRTVEISTSSIVRARQPLAPLRRQNRRMRSMLVTAMLFMSVAASAQEPRAAVVPTVVTSGEGLVQAVPDRAWVTITAESRASNPREAQRRNAEAMAPVQEKLRAAGLPAGMSRGIPSMFALMPSIGSASISK